MKIIHYNDCYRVTFVKNTRHTMQKTTFEQVNNKLKHTT